MSDNILVQRIGELLRVHQLSISTAESCTGGLLAAKITEIPGSSEYFGLGVITYSNEAKVNVLGVFSQTLEIYGAVSRQTVLEMAAGIRISAASDFSIAITGIAGPGGGTPTKPVGLVFLGFSSKRGSNWEKLNLEGDRNEIRSKAVEAALELVYREIKQRN